MPDNQKLIFVTGGVLSGVGKGIATASIGRLLVARGHSVNSVKIDPYVNIDAGTMRPTEHGEVWVTEDGGEIDQDFGHYERFIQKNIPRKNNITTGQIYQSVIERERRGEYLGKTVQIIPHITDEVKRRILEAAKDSNVTTIEIGGTVGDYENVPFLEAARQLRMELGKRNVLFVHVPYVPVLDSVGEQKTKPAQHSVKMLMEIGIMPDVLICRSERPIDSVRKEKIALFCNLRKPDIFSDYDVDCVYRIPLILDEQGLTERIMRKLQLEEKKNDLAQWGALVDKFTAPGEELRVGIVGKYVNIGEFKLADSYVSVNESLKHAAAEIGARPKIEWIDSGAFEEDGSRLPSLDGLDGVIVPGGFGSSGVEGKILAIKECRERKIPLLGLCFGLQLAVVEHARNVCGMKGAHSTEIDPDTKYPVIDILPEQKAVDKKGGTMRLGAYPAVLKEGTKVRGLYEGAGRLYGDTASERHRHRYEVNPEYSAKLECGGLVFSGRSPDGTLVEFLERSDHPYFVATQAHPEFKSRPGDPAPLFSGFVRACLQRHTGGKA